MPLIPELPVDPAQPITEPVAQDRKETTASTELDLITTQLNRVPMPSPIRRILLWSTGAAISIGLLAQLLGSAVSNISRAITDVRKTEFGGYVFLLACVLLGVAILIAIFKEIAIKRQRRKEEREEQKVFEIQVIELKKAPTISEPDTTLKHDSALVRAIENKKPAEAGAVVPQLIAVISGKGGVGKSLLSLGLLEHLSRYGPTLLVDFDLHNRGLTSLLSTVLPEARGYVIGVVREFLERAELKALLEAYQTSDPSGAVTPKAVDVFDELLEKKLQYLPLSSFADAPARKVDHLSSPLRPQNAFFLPSIPPGDSFLASKKVRDASEDAAFLFFKTLLYRANHADHIPTVIVDCHGAHDLYTVGLTRAATHLIIVTTPEMGGLDGTRDLMRFALNVISSGDDELPRSVLVVNRCRPDDWNAAVLAEQWNDLGKEGEPAAKSVVRIEKYDAVERLSRHYRFGGLAAVREYWPHIEEEIAGSLNLPHVRGKSHEQQKA